MSNLQMWSLIVGFILPPVIAVIQQRHWGQGFRASVTFVVCGIASAGTIFVQQEGNWDWSKWVGTSLLILVTTISTYKGFWKPTGVAPAVETSTSPSPRA